MPSTPPYCSVQTFIGSDFIVTGGGYVYKIVNFGQARSGWRETNNDWWTRVGYFDKFESNKKASYKDGDSCGDVGDRRGDFIIVLTSDPSLNGQLSVSEPSTCYYKVEMLCYEQ